MKTVPQVEEQPPYVVPYKFPSTPWVRTANGIAPLRPSKVTNVVRVDCADETVAVATYNTRHAAQASASVENPRFCSLVIVLLRISAGL